MYTYRHTEDCENRFIVFGMGGGGDTKLVNTSESGRQFVSFITVRVTWKYVTLPSTYKAVTAAVTILIEVSASWDAAP
jgi:hypothetical protein